MSTPPNTLLWILWRLHMLEQAGFIAPEKDGNVVRLSPQGLVLARRTFEAQARPSDEEIALCCRWLFESKIPTPPEISENITRLVITWEPS